MRIYDNCYELMSETGRNLWEMGQPVNPKSYQNKNVEGNADFHTKELICQQNCLTSLKDEEALFVFDQNSKAWAEAEFAERIDYSHTPINPGEAYLLREDIWKQFLQDNLDGTKKQDYTYNERFWYGSKDGVGNLALIIEELKRNPDTRQGILPMYSLGDVPNIGGKKRVPCSMYFNFMIRDNANGEKVLHICYHQRSCDFVTHFGNDVWLAWKLKEFVAGELGIRPGYLYHTIDSLHAYLKDWDKLKTPISEFFL